MSDDSFIREVDQELRQDQAKALWDRYGAYIVGAAVLVVLATSLFVAWEYWTETRANRSGDAYSQALTLAEEGQTEEAMAALQQLEADGHGALDFSAIIKTA